MPPLERMRSKVRFPLPRGATICRAGAYHAPHSHPDSAWSGVYYVDPGTASPDHLLSGVLEFLDPRSGVEAVTAPGDPYGEPFRVRPQAGLLVVFPSWLYHWVHPYAGQTPRIAISFNATLAAVAEVEGPELGFRHNGTGVAARANDVNAARCPNPNPLPPSSLRVENERITRDVDVSCAH